MTEAEAGKARRACGTCDREVDDCSFCGEEDCPSPMCYPDMLTALGLQMAQPHSHGG